MRVSSKMKLVLENTDNSNRTQSTLDTHTLSGRVVIGGTGAGGSQKPRPTSSSKKSKKNRVVPVPKYAQNPPDLLHHHF